MSEDLLARDSAARLAAQTEFEHPLVLEAGAGTGKTTTLVARVLAWTLGPGWEEVAADSEEEGIDLHERQDRIAADVLGGVVAITFTEAAAAQMASRVAEGLAAFAENSSELAPGLESSVFTTVDPTVLAARAFSLLGHLDQLGVRTIHAFCHRLLTAHPLELGLHPNFRIDADLVEIEDVIRSIVEQRTKEAYSAQGESPLIEAAAFGVGPQKLSQALLRLTTEAVPAAALAADPFDAGRIAKTRADLVKGIGAFLESGGTRLKRVARGFKAKMVVDALERTLEAIEALDPRHQRAADALCATIAQLWPTKTVEHLRTWGKGRFNKSETDALGDSAAAIRPLCLPLGNRLRHLAHLEPERTRVLRRALAPLLAELQEALRARGLSHFAHILVEAHRLLRDHPEVLDAERSKIRQLLVDEFQDTDAVQCRIVSLLAFGGSAGERPGLFVVGDPKQSIYGWRSADLAAYEGFLAQVSDAGGRTYPLVRNFRSAPVLLDEVSRAVRPVMHEEEGLQPEFIELMPSAETASASGFSSDRWAPVEVWPSWSCRALESGKLATTTTESAEIEADAVARDIRALCLEHGNVSWKDFCVLFRAMTRLEIFLDAFRRHGVPFVVTRDKQYFRRREIIDASALMRTIVDPTDQIALLTWLRSPLVGVPDAALIPLWRHQFPRRVAELSGDDDGKDLQRLETLVRQASGELPADVPGLAELRGWDDNLLAGLSTLALLRRSIKCDPADRFIERLRRTTLLEANESSRFLGQYRVANLERFFRRLQAALDSTGGDVRAVLRALRRSVTEAHEAEEALPRDAAENAIQVMTIHKAKGLEFKHVYIVQVDASSKDNSADATDVDRHWGPDGPEDWSLLGAATLDFGKVKDRRRQVEAAEQVRLLYVAMTRARDRLVLSGKWNQTKRTGGSAVPTFLTLLMKREGQSETVADLASRAVDGPGYVDADGLRWKFPVLMTTPSDAPTLRQHESELPDPQAARSRSARLAKLQTAARERMKRVIIGSASFHSEELSAAPTGAGPLSSRTAAQLVGSAIHRALESWDLGADPSAELSRQCELVFNTIDKLVAHAERKAARQRAEEILQRLDAGQLLGRLRDAADRIVARKLSVLVRTEGGTNGPIAGISGVVDLVLRDAESGELVIVDYKTDDVEDDIAMAERAALYEPQIATYVRALQQALDLNRRPRSELWFLWPDQVWPIP